MCTGTAADQLCWQLLVLDPTDQITAAVHIGMQAPASAHEEDLLSVVLQNCNTNLDLADAARLLCTSQATADLVRQLLAGTFRLPSQGYTSAALADARLSWLSKNAVLLGTIDYLASPSAAAASAAKAFTAALARAAALPAGLMLRSLSTTSLDVLQVSTTSRFLTSVCLTLGSEFLFPSAHELTACIAGLGGQLRTLILHADWILFYSNGNSAKWPYETWLCEPGRGVHSLLQEALPQLHVLTSLAVSELPDACLLKYAPPQLKELEVLGISDRSKDALELGHLTGLTDLYMFRHRDYEQEGWRVVNAPDVLPPNLKVLSIVDCVSATPLLPLSRLTFLSISEHCHMPVEELKHLSVLTQLRESRLGYNVWRGDFGERAAEESSAGWGFVPALRSLELHRMSVDPRSGLLKHLAGLTDLTQLVWDETYCQPDMGPWGDQIEGAYMFKDGGMLALGVALPPSLVQVVFKSFLPCPDERFGLREEAIVLGVRDFKLAVLERLPLLQMQDCSFDPDCGLSDAGRELVDMILAADLRLPEADAAVMEAFVAAYPDWPGSDVSSGEEEEGDTGDEEMDREGFENGGEEEEGVLEEGQQEAAGPEGAPHSSGV